MEIDKFIGSITNKVYCKINAPNKLAAKLTASSNYNGKRFNILRCVEYSS